MRHNTGRQLRQGGANMLSLLVVASLVAILLLVVALALLSHKEQEGAETLTLYCAAGIRVPVEEVVQQYQDAYGVRVERVSIRRWFSTSGQGEEGEALFKQAHQHIFSA